MELAASDVFVPGAYPQHSYVERSGNGLEQMLEDALSVQGQVISLSGPSKSGKTVLVERVVGRDQLITISGATLRRAEEVWDRALDWMDLPNRTARSEGTTTSIGGGASVKGGVSVPLIAKGEMEGTISAETAKSTGGESVRERRGLQQVIDEIGNSAFVVLLDDFHYMPREIQVEVAKSLKEAVRLGVKIVTASVSHRGDDIVRANPELRGRVRAIDLKYWNETELRRIADAGLKVLNASINSEAVSQFVRESAGSPQLMQLICLQACFKLGLRQKLDSFVPQVLAVNAAEVSAIMAQASLNTDFRSLVDVLDQGPRTRGTERKTYRFKDGTEGDVYRVALKALADDPPRLSFPYEELLKRTVRICDGDPPVGSSVTGTCLHMSKLALEKFPSERAIDWDEQKQVFDIPDPYLLFYLRWSDRLRQS